MNVRYTAAAQQDLADIVNYTSEHFPGSSHLVEESIVLAVERIALWPESARKVSARSGVRAVAVTRYPFVVFYRIQSDEIEILGVRHSARRPMD